MADARAFKINFYSGIFYSRDAISNSLYQKYSVVDSLRHRGTAIETRIFTHATDYDLDVRLVGSAGEAVLHSDFRDADLHMYEFGIYFDLFNSIMLKTSGRKLVFFHNITPRHLIENRDAIAAIERSEEQINNLWQADRIVCISEFNRKDLVDRGFHDNLLSVIPLPPAIPIEGKKRSLRPKPGPDNLVHYLFVGRFTPAKGVLDLVRAAGILKRQGLSSIRIELVGAMRYSDHRFITGLRELIASENVGDIVHLTGELDDDTLAEAYCRADVFVIPSYHEGYCVPLIEAMIAGCFPIAYDAGNLPFLMSGWGLLVKPGDVAGLAGAIGEVAERLNASRRTGKPSVMRTERGEMEESKWRDAVAHYVSDYSTKAFHDRITSLVSTEMAHAGISALPTKL